MMTSKQGTTLDRFIDKLESSLQLVEELEEMLQQVRDKKTAALEGAGFGVLEHRANVH